MAETGAPTSAPDALQRRVEHARSADVALAIAAASVLGAAGAVAFSSPLAGVAAGTLTAALLASRSSRLDAARRLERRDPELDGAVTAFVEGGGGRLRDELAHWVLARRPRASYRRSLVALACAVGALGAAFLVRAWPGARAAGEARTAAPGVAAPAPFLRVAVEVVPPAYARRPKVRVESLAGPIEALKGSAATLSIATSASSVALTEEGGETRTLAVTEGKAEARLTLVTSTAVRLGDDVVVTFRVLPDRAPEVELALPREDRNVSTPPGPFDVRAVAKDDVGLESLALFYTLAHGRGEGMTFKSGRVDGPRVSGLAAELATRVDPAALGLGKGDTLVLWAEAADGNAVDGPSRTASSARILRFEEELARIEMKSSAPAVRPLNGPLSQREILARTVRLLAEGLPKERLHERSLELAEEQGKLRAAFGLFLRAEDGNAIELDMEEEEAGQEVSDSKQRLLAEAVSAMWSSEGELSTGNARASLPHQRLALKKLEQAFGNERYALRALAPPKSAVDEGRRLKGDAKGLAPRTAPDPPVEGRLAAADAARLTSLARRLLLFAEGLPAAPARALADELWALPALGGLSRSTLAAPLYAAKTPEESSRAARRAADALLVFLDPSPLARPAVSKEEERLFSRLERR